MRRCIFRLCAELLVLLATVSSVLAAPVVIYNTGQTASIAPYLEAGTIKRQHDPDSVRSTTVFLTLQNLLPVRTPEMTPGRLPATELDAKLRQRLQQLPRPLFLVGADRLSRQWLVQYRDRLEQLGAVGMLIQAESSDELEAVQHAAAGLPIILVSASSLARALGLTHYPVLISPEGIEQ